MQTVLTVVHLLLALSLIGLILLQHGKGADAGAAFGSGASATVFGSRGSANFLSRTTAALAVAFFVTSLTMGYFAMRTAEDQGLMTQPVPAEPAAPAPGSDDTPAPRLDTEVPAAAPPADIPQVPE